MVEDFIRFTTLTANEMKLLLNNVTCDR